MFLWTVFRYYGEKDGIKTSVEFSLLVDILPFTGKESRIVRRNYLVTLPV